MTVLDDEATAIGPVAAARSGRRVRAPEWSTASGSAIAGRMSPLLTDCGGLRLQGTRRADRCRGVRRIVPGQPVRLQQTDGRC